jgi:lipopolysaccharide export system permease protein
VAVRLYPTFGGYVGRQFLIWWGGIFLALVFLIELFDGIEMLRRTAREETLTFWTLVAMTLFKLPHLAEQAVPFAVLFGGMMAFWRLNRHQELVVARASGMSAWEFLLPVMLIALAIGVVKITVYNPFASAMLLQFERLEAQLVHGRSSLAAISGDGLWLRQSTADGHYMLHAASIDPQRMELGKVLVLAFRGTDRFAYRIDADRAVLDPGAWRLENARISRPEAPPDREEVFRIATDLTRENIQDSFATPETLSFWAIPGFIQVLEQAGFSALRHRLYWQSQLADPLLLCAMVLFAAAFTLRPQRRGGTTLIIAGGVATGFLIYFASDVAYALGLSARIPVALSAWSPAVVACLLGAAILFHLEDG